MAQISARPAATTVVIRERNELLEILMLRRSVDAVAASGAYVFPGGGVDAADADVVARRLVHGLDPATADGRLELAHGALDYYCAALRELFEEAGILLAVDARGRPLSFDGAQLLAWRAELHDRRVGWADLLAREGLRLALGEMHYLAHWVTPDTRPRRFDTRFFVARAPTGQSVRVDGAEVTAHVWTSASAALRRFATEEWTLLVPTVHTLTVLAPMRRCEEVVRHADTSHVTRTQPREILREGRVVVVVPGEAGYDDEG
ncbi:MAG: NUDIX domain-containing protein [Acidobacteria bacterium]|nr:NUDIX domain-containing protein [Acidobacteriota bacterium]